MQARRLDSVTGGQKQILEGAREIYLCEFESVDQTKKVKTTKSGFHLKVLAIFHKS